MKQELKDAIESRSTDSPRLYMMIEKLSQAIDWSHCMGKITDQEYKEILEKLIETFTVKR